MSNGLKNIISEDFFITYFNGSRIPKPFFKKSEFTENITKNLKVLNANYENIYLIFSFHHLHAKKLTKNKEYYIDQVKFYKNYIKIIKEINPSIEIFMIQDTPLPKDSAFSCEKFIEIFNDYNICDFHISDDYKLMEKELFKKLSDVFRVINVNEYFCKSSKCNFYDSNGYPIIWDGSHFTPRSELSISKKILTLMN